MSETRTTIAVGYLLALSTACVPEISVSPPALGKTYWSMWDFWSLIFGPSHTAFDPEAFLLLLFSLLPIEVYPVLLFGMLLLWLPNYLKPSMLVTFLCLDVCLPTRSYKAGVSHMLKHAAGWHGTVTISPEAFVLPAVLAFLMFFLVTEWNDSAEGKRSSLRLR